MAITQQLVMVTESELKACQVNDDALNSLVSFEFAPERYLDLDWAPKGLGICFERSGQSSEARQAIEWSLDGTEPISATFANSKWGYKIWSPITFLEADKVQIVAQHLQQINKDILVAWLPEDLEEANAMMGDELLIHPRIYYSEKFEQLTAFYKTVAQNNMAVVMWWD